MAEHYVVRYNVLSGISEWQVDGSFVTIDDRTIRTFVLEAHEAGVRATEREVRLYLGSTRVPSYHPGRTYLESVRGRWNGRRDYVALAACQFGCTAPQRMAWFGVWLRGVVQGWLQGGSMALSAPPFLEGQPLALLLPPTLRDSSNKPSHSLHYPRLYAQLLAQVERGDRCDFTDAEQRLLARLDDAKMASRPEVQSFRMSFVPALEMGRGVLALRLSDITESIRYRQGFDYDNKQKNLLGRWLTSEYRAGRIAKRTSGGAVTYLVRPVFGRVRHPAVLPR